jgi:hypothetical protein
VLLLQLLLWRMTTNSRGAAAAVAGRAAADGVAAARKGGAAARALAPEELTSAVLLKQPHQRGAQRLHVCSRHLVDLALQPSTPQAAR